MTAPLLDIAFTGLMIEWRGPAPFHFVLVPAPHVAEIAWAARQASYGWGCVPVAAEVAGAAFRTSLFPRPGGYLLPVKAAVRARAGIALGDTVRARITVEAR